MAPFDAWRKVKLRAVVCLLGGLFLAAALGLAWALHFPSTRANNIFFGGLLMPLAWVGAMLWLWFGNWVQLCQRLLGAGAVLGAAVYLGLRFG